MSNGDVIQRTFPNVEIKYYHNLSGIQTVDVKFADVSLNGTYATHTFSRDWWNSEYQKKKDSL